MIGIYKITNTVNGKSYIGQSKHIKRRWREHINGLEQSAISNAIQKYGVGNFTFETLERCSIENLYDREMYYIDKFKTYGKGYNMTVGGDGVRGYGSVLSPDVIPRIIADLRSTLSIQDIKDKYKVCYEMIYRINRGAAWVIEGEHYPIRDDKASQIKKMDRNKLLEEVANLGFHGAGLLYGLTGNGIKNRCKLMSLPTQIKEIRELYGNEIIIEARLNSEVLNVRTLSELINYIYDNKLSDTDNKSHIGISVRRLFRGDRKSYLGITLEKVKLEEHT